MNRQTTENKNGKTVELNSNITATYFSTSRQSARFSLSYSSSKSHRPFSAWRRGLSGCVGKFISYARYNIDDWLLSSFASAALLLFCFDKRMGIKLTKTVANENEKMLRKQQIAKALRQSRRRASSECANPLTRN